MPAIWVPISSVPWRSGGERLTSWATTAKPLPARRRAPLDGGIQRQQIGLLRDGGNELDDIADPARRFPTVRRYAHRFFSACLTASGRCCSTPAPAG